MRLHNTLAAGAALAAIGLACCSDDTASPSGLGLESVRGAYELRIDLANSCRSMPISTIRLEGVAGAKGDGVLIPIIRRDPNSDVDFVAGNAELRADSGGLVGRLLLAAPGSAPPGVPDNGSYSDFADLALTGVVASSGDGRGQVVAGRGVGPVGAFWSDFGVAYSRTCDVSDHRWSLSPR